MEDYIAQQDEPVRQTLETLRDVIAKAAPEAEKSLVYSMPAFKYKGHLVGFAVQKNHLSFFTMSPKLATEMKTEITKTHPVSGATIHFSVDNPLSKSLVTKIVKARIIENNERK